MSTPTPSASTLRVRVQPKAKRPASQLLPNGTVLLRVTAPPEKGKANRACIDLLARLLGVPRAALNLVRGEHSRDKTFAVEGLSEAELGERLRDAFAR